jgi:short-subunit dehydrogenase
MKLESGGVALVTGASSGIGRALSLALARRGLHVAALARSGGRLKALADEVGRSGPECLPLVCDVRDPDSVATVVEQTVARFGRLDLIVNNAGFGSYTALSNADPGELRELMEVNYFGAVHVTRAALPMLVERRRGHLVFVASVAGRIPPARHSGYAATKSALIGFAESLSLELDAAHIGVTIVNPGIVSTGFFDRPDFRDFPAVLRRQTIPPDRVARATLRAIERDLPEIFVPGSLRYAHLLKTLAPRLFRAGSLRFARRTGMIEAPSGRPAPSSRPAPSGPRARDGSRSEER